MIDHPVSGRPDPADELGEALDALRGAAERRGDSFSLEQIARAQAALKRVRCALSWGRDQAPSG